jgi:hypothetical protein
VSQRITHCRRTRLQSPGRSFRAVEALPYETYSSRKWCGAQSLFRVIGGPLAGGVDNHDRRANDNPVE